MRMRNRRFVGVNEISNIQNQFSPSHMSYIMPALNHFFPIISGTQD
jgi:hypothetical protein